MESVWSVIVHHPTVARDVSLVCNLLCVSKSLRAAIALQCRGCLSVAWLRADKWRAAWYPSYARSDVYCYPSDLFRGFEQWLLEHGESMEQLQLTGTTDGAVGRVETEAAIALALQQSAQRGGLLLQSFTAELASAVTAGLLLQQMPAQHLCSLDLTLCEGLPSSSSNSSSLAASALARLTGLQSLTLQCRAVAAFDSWLPAVAAMTRLTRLHVDNMCSAQPLQQLPPHLVELHLAGEVSDALAGALQLSHLTALTKLHGGQRLHVVVRQGDTLPPALLELHVLDCMCVEPLLLLTQLRVLHMGNTTTSAAQLLEVSRCLTRLTDIGLEYYCSDGVYPSSRAVAAAPAWSSLSQLHHLHLGGQTLPMAALQQLRGLTSLSICLNTMLEEGPLDLPAVAAVVQQQSALQRLVVDGTGDFEADPADFAQLCQVIASCQHLQQLTLASLPVDSAAASQLTTATQLTQLHMFDLVLDSFAFSRIVCSLTGLKNLELTEMRPSLVTDVHMPAIAALLTGLTELDLDQAAVTDEGLACLSRLTQLKQLSVSNALVTEQGWRRAMRLA